MRGKRTLELRPFARALGAAGLILIARSAATQAGALECYPANPNLAKLCPNPADTYVCRAQENSCKPAWGYFCASSVEECGGQEYARRIPNRVDSSSTVDSSTSRRIQSPSYLGRENAEDCTRSQALGLKCSSTKSLVEGAQVANQVGQMAGSMAVGMAGGRAQNEAMSEGTASAAMQAAASTQKRAAQAQLLVGATNAALGVLQMTSGMQHGRNAARIDKETRGESFDPDHGMDVSGKTKTAQDIRQKFGDEGFDSIQEQYRAKYDSAKQEAQGIRSLNTPGSQLAANNLQKARMQQADREAVLAASSRARQIGGSVSAEQRAMADKAKSGAMMSMISSAQQMAQGYFNMKAAKELEAAARKMKAPEAQSALQIPEADNFPLESQAPRGSTVISGGNPAPESAAAKDEETEDAGSGGELGPPPPVGPPGGDIAGAPNVGGWNPPAGGGTAGGGGGGGGIGGASTQAASPDNTDMNPRAASPNGVTYREGDSAGGGAKGSAALGGGMGDGNLLSQLAKAFGMKDEAPNGADSATFAGGPGRDPASEGSLLDPSADLFRNIHEAYKQLQQDKRI